MKVNKNDINISVKKVIVRRLPTVAGMVATTPFHNNTPLIS